MSNQVIAHLEGTATWIGGLEVLRISDAPFTDPLPSDRIRIEIPATLEDIHEAAVALANGEKRFL